MTENNPQVLSPAENRDAAVELAGALQMRVDEIFARNDELEALCDSYRVAKDAVESENIQLRKLLDLRTRQRDAAVRERDLFRAQMRKIQSTANETMRAVTPEETRPGLPDADPANLAFLRKPQSA